MQGSLLLRSQKHLALRVRQQAEPTKSISICARRSVVVRDGSGPDKKSSFADVDVDDCETNIAADYCSIDEDGRRVDKRTIGEMEQDFLSALGSWYYESKPKMSDEEFAVLKEELIWGGSKVAILDSNEQRFLEASMAFARGTPIVSDAEYDKLKVDLKTKSSVVTAEGPRCSLRSKKMYADADPDYLKMTLLNLPAALLILGAIFAVDDVTGFEISTLIELPAPWGTALLWGVLFPILFVVSYGLTNVGFKDNLILKGNCPNCATENGTYFGNIFTVAGNRGQNVVECTNCKALLTFDENKRIVVVDETPEQRETKKAAIAAKKKVPAPAA